MRLADRYEPMLRRSFLHSVRTGHKVNTIEVLSVFSRLVNETAESSAEVYEMEYEPNNTAYLALVNELVKQYTSLVNDSYTRSRIMVRGMIPQSTPLHEIGQRLQDAFGLDVNQARSLERYRQELHASPKPHTKIAIADSIKRARQDSLLTRSNLLARTEAQRAVNLTLETLWVANSDVSLQKAVSYLQQEDPTISHNVYVERGTTRPRRKEWLTRRDNRVCDYCDPMDELTAPLGKSFDTPYGPMIAPPAHPACRCVLFLV